MKKSELIIAGWALVWVCITGMAVSVWRACKMFFTGHAGDALISAAGAFGLAVLCVAIANLIDDAEAKDD